MSDEHVASDTAALTAGKRLRQAREALGLTHAEVAAKLKLASRQIEAMEEEDWASLPERPYARGFYRNYARLVGIDPATLTFDLASTQPEPPHQSTRLELPTQELGTVPHEGGGQPRKAAAWLIPLVLLLALAAGVAYLQWSGEPLSRTPAATGSPPGQASAPAPRAPEPSVTATSAPAAPASVPTPTAEVSSPGIATPPGQRRVRLVFAGKSWTEIRSNGEIVFSETAAPGIREFDAPAPLSFVIGNASVVKLEIDGKPYDFSSSIRNEVARFQIP